MDTKLKAAVIGVGRAEGSIPRKGGGKIGYFHADLYQRNPQTVLVAGADINRENLLAWRQAFGGPSVYENHKDMLADARPDIVSICTYVGLHGPILRDCVDAGVRGVFCEKPFLASPLDIAQVRAALDRGDTRVIVAHYRRYQPLFQRMRELVLEGAIGDPLLIWGSMPGWDLSEWGSHWLDLFRFVNGDPSAEWIMGQARVRSGRGYGHAMEEQAIAYFSLANGCKGLLDGGGDLGVPYHMIVTGTRGELRLAGDPAGELIFSGESTLSVASGSEAWTETYPAETMEFETGLWDQAVEGLISWINRGPEPPVGVDRVLETTELYLAAYLSAVTRDRVDLPLSDLSSSEWPLEALAQTVEVLAGEVG